MMRVNWQDKAESCGATLTISNTSEHVHDSDIVQSPTLLSVLYEQE